LHIAARTDPSVPACVCTALPPSLAASALCYLRREHVYFDSLLLSLPLTTHRDMAVGE
jgi:hypothetical protein